MGDSFTSHGIHFGEYYFLIEYMHTDMRYREFLYIYFCDDDEYLKFRDYTSDLEEQWNIVDNAIKALGLKHTSRNEFLDFLILLTDA